LGRSYRHDVTTASNGWHKGTRNYYNTIYITIPFTLQIICNINYIMNYDYKAQEQHKQQPHMPLNPVALAALGTELAIGVVASCQIPEQHGNGPAVKLQKTTDGNVSGGTTTTEATGRTIAMGSVVTPKVTRPENTKQQNKK
jgi:hypothetical protein